MPEENELTTDYSTTNVSNQFSTGISGISRENIIDSNEELCEPCNKAKEIRISALDYGYMVKIGCQNFAIESVEKLVNNLKAYLNDPNVIEQKWLKDKKLL